jgi:hypothetical protein
MPTENGVAVSNEVIVAFMGALSAKFDADVKMLNIRLTADQEAAKLAFAYLDKFGDKVAMAFGQAIAVEQGRSAARHAEWEREMLLKEAEQKFRFEESNKAVDLAMAKIQAERLENEVRLAELRAPARASEAATKAARTAS